MRFSYWILSLLAIAYLVECTRTAFQLASRCTQIDGRHCSLNRILWTHLKSKKKWSKKNKTGKMAVHKAPQRDGNMSMIDETSTTSKTEGLFSQRLLQWQPLTTRYSLEELGDLAGTTMDSLVERPSQTKKRFNAVHRLRRMMGSLVLADEYDVFSQTDF